MPFWKKQSFDFAGSLLGSWMCWYWLQNSSTLSIGLRTMRLLNSPSRKKKLYAWLSFAFDLS